LQLQKSRSEGTVGKKREGSRLHAKPYIARGKVKGRAGGCPLIRLGIYQFVS